MGSALSDLPSWWSEAGSAGWNQDLWLGATPPWTLGGVALGAWSLLEPDRAPVNLVFPGVAGMQTPLVWYDTVAVVAGEGAAWQGFGASLATATGWTRRLPGRGDARATLDLRTGDFAFDENTLTIERGDSSAWMRGEVAGDSRGLAQGYAVSGRHQWGAAGGMIRGRHSLQAAYTERGAAASLVSEEEQGSSGESGALRYRLRAGALDAGLSLERSYDHHDSFNLGNLDLRPYSRRDAQAVAGAADARYRSGLGDLAMRLEVRRARVRRSGGDAFDRRSTSAWGALRLERGLGDGIGRLEIGAGRHSWTGYDLAPALSYRVQTPSFTGRVGVERVLYPVWADLAPAQETFLQRTWAGVIEVAAGGSTLPRARATFLAGRTYDRALVSRLPLEELWLRFGSRADPAPYDFGLLMLEAVWKGRRLSAGGDGYVLARSQNTAQPLVDPALGMRSWAAWDFTAFSGDLGVTLRAELEGVGGRETEGESSALCGEFEGIPSRTLPPYVTTGATAVLTLAGAVFTVRVRNLEDRPHEETWVDCAAVSEALGPGREWRFAVTVRLMN